MKARSLIGLGVAAAMVAAAYAAFLGERSFAEDRKDGVMKAQLTIYVAPPLLDTGGTVIVVANPISRAEWQALPDGDNPAEADPNNAKKKELGEGDRLFGVVASTKVIIVEFGYPEDGTFGFNLVALDESGRSRPPLRTREISIGDGGYVDWSTGEEFTWDYVSTIHILGPEVSEGDSRGVRVSSSKIMNLHPSKTIYEGAVLYSPTDEQVDKAVLTDEELK